MIQCYILCISFYLRLRRHIFLWKNILIKAYNLWKLVKKWLASSINSKRSNPRMWKNSVNLTTKSHCALYLTGPRSDWDTPRNFEKYIGDWILPLRAPVVLYLHNMTLFAPVVTQITSSTMFHIFSLLKPVFICR